ncbi:MAG: YdcF family protein [Alphaproteobacteria bacterium]
MTDFLRSMAPLLLPNLLLWALILGVLTTRSKGRLGQHINILKAIAGLLLIAAVPAVPITATNLWALSDTTYSNSRADAVVVLTAGLATYDTGNARPSHESYRRGLAAARVAAENALPLLIVGGGETAAQGLSEAAVLAASLPIHEPVLLEEASLNTWENALLTHAILDEQGWSAVILVTDPAHARRALASFRANGIDVVRFVAAQDLPSVRAADFIPSISGLGDWRTIGHEAAGLAYYMFSGFIGFKDL